MFVGFEDTEFSLRLYQSGMKVGACGIACVIHDHPKPENHSDIHYEKQRFSRNYLKESAEYFEKKHGFSVWNPMVDNWVEQRISELKLEPSAGRSSSQRRKIALIVDRRGWALDNIAAQIVKNLSDSFDFKTLYLSDFNNLGQLLMLADDCQMLHFLWRPLASYYYRDFTQNYIRRLGMTSGDFYRKYVEGKTISVAVYDHLMLSESETDYHYTPDLFSSPDFATVLEEKSAEWRQEQGVSSNLPTLQDFYLTQDELVLLFPSPDTLTTLSFSIPLADLSGILSESLLSSLS